MRVGWKIDALAETHAYRKPQTAKRNVARNICCANRAKIDRAGRTKQSRFLCILRGANFIPRKAINGAA
jgi:hypothetical protein